ncbi:OmpP1/FadL family transporter [Capnocytophaga canis]|uniref:Transporter n=2 Tax=Capnocytophaga canis TaxID=1848903 RepID=A0A3A1YHN8_9FLAO|nr:outer membrane protein transport protein [Capnocytophaga canis]RIY37662.1 hypothetical protein CKY20_02915 [Capnocytophaga canis]
MKKRLLSIMLLSGGIVSAQNINDALRYSVEDLDGTARYRAMSGAFGALGGDLSAITVNPAGSAIFSSSEFSISLGNDAYKKNVTFKSQTTNNEKSDFNVNQVGVALVIPTNSEQWKKITFGFNYQRSVNFNNANFTYFGQNNIGLDNYYHYFATQGNARNTPFNLGVFEQGLAYDVSDIEGQKKIGDFYINLKNANARATYLGLMTELIVPKSNDFYETDYELNSNGSSRFQKYENERFGKINKYNMNFAAQFNDNISLGANINIHNLNTNSLFSLREDKFNEASLIKYANHQMTVNTEGYGFSFQLGAIAKLNKNIRIGTSYHSPTWYSLVDMRREVLFSDIFINATNRVEGRDVELLNKYGDEIWFERKYKFRTPGSWTASAAYIFGKNGLISFDYIYKGYGKTYFRTENLKSENTVIQNELGDTSAIRLGGEYRIKALSLRAGIRHEQSPYKTGIKYIGDLTGYSLGLGYALGGVRFDLSYDVAKQDNYHRIYESVLTTPAKMTSTRSNILLTMSIKLF